MLKFTDYLTYPKFWSKVDKTAACWLWTANTDRDGYGNITVNKKQYKAHRFSLLIHGVNVPKGSIVMHTCDNPRCVNPEHLIVNTQQANILDRDNKNRQAVGEANGASVLTASSVLEIRQLYPMVPMRKLAKQYAVSDGTIRSIVRRWTWRHL